VNGSTVAVGNAEWLQRHGVIIPSSTTAGAETETAGATHIYVAICDKFAGELTLRDEVRAGSVYVVEKLRQMGVEPVMLSGAFPCRRRHLSLSLIILTVKCGPNQLCFGVDCRVSPYPAKTIFLRGIST
jgi:DUF1365 family protein